ncbi:unnamed protein product [Schistocephalus solidus]|uniref:Uncharacterized protein n=1 Tax=Schistocephalus solidus TaxID=70667 RepID=A0A183SEZ5_SCHSO|nr:unnamed protein product [Schistocephalus solidus]
MLLWPPLTGTQLSPVAPRSWVFLKRHNPGNRTDRRAKPGCSGESTHTATPTKSSRKEAASNQITGKLEDLHAPDDNASEKLEDLHAPDDNATVETRWSNSANTPSDSPKLTPGINSITTNIIETTSLFSLPVTPTTATTPAFTFPTTTTSTGSDGDSLLNCPHRDHTFT